MRRKADDSGEDLGTLEPKVLPTFFKNKKVVISPVAKPSLWKGLTDKEVNAPGFYPNTSREFTVPLRLDDYVHSVFDEFTKQEWAEFPGEELTECEVASRYKNMDLSSKHPLSSGKCYWGTPNATYKLDSSKAILTLNNIDDVIKYRVLLLNKSKIAPNPEVRFSKNSYQFFVEDTAVVEQAAQDLAEKRDEAMTIYASMKEDVQEMRDFLLLFEISTPREAQVKDLRKYLQDLMKTEESIIKFVNEYNNPKKAIVIALAKAIRIGQILPKSNGAYVLPDKTEIDNFAELVRFWDSPKNQEKVLRIAAKIESDYK